MLHLTRPCFYVFFAPCFPVFRCHLFVLKLSRIIFFYVTRIFSIQIFPQLSLCSLVLILFLLGYLLTFFIPVRLSTCFFGIAKLRTCWVKDGLLCSLEKILCMICISLPSTHVKTSIILRSSSDRCCWWGNYTQESRGWDVFLSHLCFVPLSERHTAGYKFVSKFNFFSDSSQRFFIRAS